MPTQGPFSPTIGENIVGIGTRPWSNPGNIFTSNNIYASCSNGISGISNYLRASGFGFSLPGNAVVDGYTATIEGASTFLDDGDITDNVVQLCSAGVQIGNNKATSATWPFNVDTIATYGSSSDLWGVSLSSAQVNDSTFGFSVSNKEILAATTRSRVDHMTMTVSYHLVDLYPFWDFKQPEGPPWYYGPWLDVWYP